MRVSVSGGSGFAGKPMALAATRDVLRIRSAALFLLAFLFVLTSAVTSVAEEQRGTEAAPDGATETYVPNGTLSPVGEAPKAGLQPDVPDSLPSCCSWASVAAFLAGSKGQGSHTMAETLYTLSTQDALRVVADASTVEKNYLRQPASSQKRKGLMEAKKNLQQAYEDLRVEMGALARDDVPGKAELSTNMKNALDVIQRHLAIHQRILSGKTVSPALLRDIGLLDRLLVRISADCREYLAGG